jgi:hypothetical protein
MSYIGAWGILHRQRIIPVPRWVLVAPFWLPGNITDANGLKSDITQHNSTYFFLI